MLNTIYTLEKQRKGKKGNLTDECSCSNEYSCVLPFLKKREEGQDVGSNLNLLKQY